MIATTPGQTTADRRDHGYRPDIDGLRAIAVLSVIVFHLWRTALPGGYVGVDIFFVISGFLITTHIRNDVVAGTFSLAAFYARRVKRIAPAMLVVVGLTAVVAELTMLPEDARAAAKSGFFSVSSFANVFFWRYQDTDYFGAQGLDLPLLNLWSLGVEEQFYVIWPLVLMWFYRVEHARAFLVGMTVAALSDRWRRVPRRVLTALAVMGLVMLLASVTLLHEQVVFPGLLAVPATLGTTLLILTRRDDQQIVTRMLSVRPMVWVGLVSYSAYLWHWPLLTFYRYGFGDPGFVAGCALFVATMTLAWLSYRFVEQPARRAKAPLKQIFIRQFFVPAGAVGAACLAIVYADRVWSSRTTTPYRNQLAILRAEVRPAHEYPYVCQRQRLTPADLMAPGCVLGHAATSEPSILLWGDSNAAHYIGVIGAFAHAAGFRFRNIALGACPPLLTDSRRYADARRHSDCAASAPLVDEAIERASVVIVGGSWAIYQTRSKDFMRDAHETLRELTRRGKKVIVLGRIPILDGFDRECREKALKYPAMQCDAVRRPLMPLIQEINDGLRALADTTDRIEYYDVNSFLCPDGTCSSARGDGRNLYYDPGHFSLAGSWSVGEGIVRRDGVPAVFANLASLTSAPR
ncbi:MAG TPA: acyltransferase family protein [Gemmatimonadaceae bacterium]